MKNKKIKKPIEKKLEILCSAAKRLKEASVAYKAHYQCTKLHANIIKDLDANYDLLLKILNAEVEDMPGIIKDHDEKLYKHCKNVAELVKEMVKIIDINESEGKAIYEGALIHELGKLFTNAYNNKIKLNGCEKAEHVIINDLLMYLRDDNNQSRYRSIEEEKKNEILRNIMTFHHQRPNIEHELCYPFVINPISHQISPYEIIQPADTYDAMHNRGGYQKIYSNDEIIEHLIKNARDLYAVEPIDALLKVLGKENIDYCRELQKIAEERF